MKHSYVGLSWAYGSYEDVNYKKDSKIKSKEIWQLFWFLKFEFFGIDFQESKTFKDLKIFLWSVWIFNDTRKKKIKPHLHYNELILETILEIYLGWRSGSFWVFWQSNYFLAFLSDNSYDDLSYTIIIIMKNPRQYTV